MAVLDGTIISTSWNGAGGYTVIVNCSPYQISYCHVDPNFLVTPNQSVEKGQVIANIGPLNVYGVKNNPYKDKNGNPTNGATTGCHLHLSVRKNGEYIDPMTLF